MGIEGTFAYDSYRPGQKELAQRVYESSSGGETLLAEAMSGFGKTAAVLAGALAAGEETGCKIVYACRTKRQIHRVVEEVSRLQKRRAFKAAYILSKFDYCLLKRQRAVPRESFGWYCSFNTSNNLCSYFLNVPLVGRDFDRAVKKALYSAPTHEALLRESESIHVCPYEVAKLAVVQAQVAIAPYHYVFDPRAAPILFDSNSLNAHKSILVVDEAHNLRDFLRGIRSATLTMDQVTGAIREAKALLMDEAAQSLEALKLILEHTMATRSGWLLDRASVLDEIRSEKGAPWLQNLAFELSSCSGAAWSSIAYERRLPSLIIHVGEFLAKISSFQKAVLVKWEGTLGVIDPDPVSELGQRLREFKSSVLLSATISPSAVFIRSLGLDPAATSSYEVTSEPLLRIRTLIDVGVSTKYRLRTPEMYARISDRVAAVIDATESGVGVFAPSYSVLRPLFEMVTRRVQDRTVVQETPGLTGQEAADVFDSFRSGHRSVLFGVQGGRFSEGEDFNEESMGVVIVVGMSLPPPTPMMYAEYAFLKRAGEPDSYLMLSRLPALRKAIQAAGRHVRNPGKKGLVVLMDDRFNSETAKSLMPSWLKKDLTIADFSPWRLGSLTREFWSPN